MNSWKRSIIEVLMGVLSAMAAFFSSGVPLSVLLEVQKALIGFAGLVVTIFGIWIAVIFPVLSSLLVDGKAKQEVSQLARYDVLVRALYKSCFSLTATFFVFLVLSFFPSELKWVSINAIFFSWLVFFSTVLALWSAIWNGEGAVLGGINESIRSGMIRRLRAMGRSVKKREPGSGEPGSE